MTFDEAFALELGARVAVSNGEIEPPQGTRRHAHWRSHNFSGPIQERHAGPPRALLIEAVNQPGLTIAYTIVEGAGHSFELE